MSDTPIDFSLSLSHVQMSGIVSLAEMYTKYGARNRTRDRELTCCQTNEKYTFELN